jgi:AraC family transcriptional regulator
MSPVLLSAGFFDGRPAFSLPVETYPHWVLLGSRQGSFEFAIDPGVAGLCEAGQFVLCPPGQPLRRKSLGPISFFFFQFTWEDANAPAWPGKHELIDLHRMESTLAHLRAFADTAAPPTPWVHHLLNDLFQQRHHEQHVKHATPARPIDRCMIQAADTLRKQLARPDSLERLAESLKLTPSQFTRRFTAALGQSPSDYRTDLRMKEARRLLTETPLKLQAIAEACGYENAFYFTRVFTRETGLPPGRYRAARRV